MATKYFLGTAPAVAQVASATITAYDTGTTYKVTIGGVTVSVVGSGGTVSTTATSLVSALNASTHPYFAAITWTANSSAGVVTGTADVAGCPFTVTSSVSGGSGTFGAFSDATACSGPNFWSVAANWSDGAVPVDTDTVILRDCATNICWGLDQTSIDLTALNIERTYTGKIGLNYSAFATTADGATTTTTAPEYRENYLLISYVSATIGNSTGIGSPSGSSRILLSNTLSGASTTTVYFCATSSETGRPAIRLKTAHASAAVYIIYAPGGVGIASEEPADTTTLGTLAISDTTTSSLVTVGAGATITTLYAQGGTIRVQGLASTLTTLNVNGGSVTLDGDYTITTATISGGTVYDRHTKSAGNSVTTCNLQGGTLDLQQTPASRTYNAMAITGGTLKSSSTMTYTAITLPSATVTISAS